jgi:hypothetical protein
MVSKRIQLSLANFYVYRSLSNSTLICIQNPALPPTSQLLPPKASAHELAVTTPLALQAKQKANSVVAVGGNGTLGAVERAVKHTHSIVAINIQAKRQHRAIAMKPQYPVSGTKASSHTIKRQAMDWVVVAGHLHLQLRYYASELVVDRNISYGQMLRSGDTVLPGVLTLQS